MNILNFGKRNTNWRVGGEEKSKYKLSANEKLEYFSNKFLLSNTEKADILEDLADLLQDGVSIGASAESWYYHNKGAIKYLGMDILKANASDNKISIFDGFKGWYDDITLFTLKEVEDPADLPKAMRSCAESLRHSGGHLGKMFAALSVPTLFIAIAFFFRGYVFTSFEINVIETFENLAPRERWTQLINDYVASIYSARTHLLLLPIIIVAAFFGSSYVLKRRGDLLPIYKNTVAAKFIHNLSLLLANNVRMKDALHFIHERSDPYLKGRIDDMLVKIKRGEQNESVILDVGLIPSNIIDHFRLLSETPRGRKALSLAGIKLSKDNAKSIERVLMIIKYILFIVAIFHLITTYLSFGGATHSLSKIAY